MGVPLPGELVLLTAAAFAAQGALHPVGVVIAAWVGTLIGGTGGYWLGRTGGLALVVRYGPWFGLTKRRVVWARGFFESHGAKTVLVARFVAVLRMIAGILAGVTRMRFVVFSIANAVGGLLWAAAFGALGYVFGRNLPLLEHYLRRFTALALVLTVLVVLALIWRWRRQRAAVPAIPPAT